MSIVITKKIYGKMKGFVSDLFSCNWVVCILTLILLSFILFCRKPDAFLNPQFWAEDGSVFFKQNFLYGLKSVAIQSAGYLHLAPRLIASFASLFPVSIAPVIYNYSALASMFLIVCVLFSSRCFIPLKPLVALSIVLVPHFGEVFMTITNIQWYLCFLPLILLCMEPPVKLYQYVFDYLIIIICGLTGPFIIFILPLFIARIITKKSLHNYGILLTAFLCALIQIWFISQKTQGNQNVFSGNIDAWINILGIMIFGRLFLIKSIYEIIPPVLLAIFAVVLPIALVLFADTKKQRYLIFTFLFFGMAVFISTLYKFKGYPELIAYDVNNGERYFYIPYVMILWSLMIYLDSRKTIKRQVATVLILMIFISSAQYFRCKKYVDYNWKQYSKEIVKGEPCRIPINPPGFFIVLDSEKSNPVNERKD